MATWDTADLVSRCVFLANRPSTDESMSTANWYALLTEAQAHYYNLYCAHFPKVLMGAPYTMTTADSGVTYTFGNDSDGDPIYPLAVEIYDATGPATLLRAGAYFDSSADYVFEGYRIRSPQNLGFSGITPVARFVTPPGAIDGSHAPTLVPKHTRLLLVYWAVGEWARRGGMRDPAPYDQLLKRAWFGDPASGDIGILGALKLQNTWGGGEAVQMPGAQGILSGVDTGAGYKGMAP